MLGLIAGNGRFPLLVLEEARRTGQPVIVAAIREETDPAVEDFAGGDDLIQVHWIGLGQLGKLLKIFKRNDVDRAIMAGQVKHVKVFARDGRPAAGRLSALPDLKMLRVLLSLPRKNTASLISAFADVLAEEGIELIESTAFLQALLAEEGILTKRKPDEEEERDIEFGRPIARELASLDIGQTIVVRDQAVVSVEAMEGTDAAIRRAAELSEGRRLTVVKAARPDLDRRFDVPVLGMRTLGVCRECQVSALAIDSAQTLLLDKEEFLAEADRLGMTIVGAVR